MIEVAGEVTGYWFNSSLVILMRKIHEENWRGHKNSKLDAGMVGEQDSHPISTRKTAHMPPDHAHGHPEPHCMEGRALVPPASVSLGVGFVHGRCGRWMWRSWTTITICPSSSMGQSLRLCQGGLRVSMWCAGHGHQ